MTLAFTCILSSHGRVINWPYFTIVVSWGVARSEERERWEQLFSGTGGTYTAFFNYVCCLIGMQFIVPLNN